MPIDILNAFQGEPPPLDFIWPGFLAGTVGALVAPGATGKSYWTLEAAMSISCSVAGGDLVKLDPKKIGKVVYLAGEDPSPALARRVHAIGQHLQPTSQIAISENLILESVMGKRLNVMDARCLDYLLKLCADARLVVLDTLSRIHTLDENNNGDMARLISTLEFLSNSTGAAVLFLHHVSKDSVRDGQLNKQQAARGASALIDNARWCGYLSTMTENEAQKLSEQRSGHFPIGKNTRNFFIRFGVSKQNYHSGQPDRWYKRHDGGVLLPVELTEIKDNRKAKRRDEI